MSDFSLSSITNLNLAGGRVPIAADRKPVLAGGLAQVRSTVSGDKIESLVLDVYHNTTPELAATAGAAMK
jgi:hypothetical protein